MTCSMCKHFDRWAPTQSTSHPQFGDCTDPDQWGEGGRRLVRDCETCDGFKPADVKNGGGA